jgi:uncharacterized protein YfiM (DUF2279 family)
MGATGVLRRAAAGAALVGAACLAAGCATTVCKDNWLGPEAAKQFAAGFAVAAIPSTLAGHAGRSPQSSAAIGFGAVAAAGAAKETFQLKVSRGCWSWKDLTWNLIGGAAGSAVGTIASH